MQVGERRLGSAFLAYGGFASRLTGVAPGLLSEVRHARLAPRQRAMHSHSIEAWTHQHVFLGEQHRRFERRTRSVVGLTAAMMVAEIVGGTLFGSMALVADGWHMSTHAAALGIAALAYRFARLNAAIRVSRSARESSVISRRSRAPSFWA